MNLSKVVLNAKNSLVASAMLICAVSASAQWISNGTNSWTLNANSAASTSLNQLNLSVTNPTTAVNTINASVSSSDGSQSSGVGSGSGALIDVFGYGGGTGLAGANGPNINFTSSIGGSATVNTAHFTSGSMQTATPGPNNSVTYNNPTYMTGPGAVFTVISNGSSAGFGNNFVSTSAAPASAGNGGNINLQVTGGSLSLFGSGSTTSAAPWMPGAAAINAVSAGGTPISYMQEKSANNMVYGSGGNGGNVSVTNSANIALGSSASPTTGQFTGINALSIGTAGSVCCNTLADDSSLAKQIWPTYMNGGAYGAPIAQSLAFGPNGNGGNVSVNNTGAISSWGADSIGISATSLGGSAVANPNLTAFVPSKGIQGNDPASGVGGDVNVTNSGNLSLVGAHSFGIMAVSSANQITMPSTVFVSGSALPAGNISIQNTGSITVGAAGTSNNLISGGIVGLSSPGWMIAPSGSMVNGLTTAGAGGSVGINNSGSIAAYGNSTFGVAALSIGNSGVLSNSSATTSNYYMGNGATTNSKDSSGGSASVINSGAITLAGQGSAGLIAIANGDGGLISNTASPVIPSTAIITTNPITKIQTTNAIIGTTAGNNSGTYTANGGTASVSNSGAISTGISGGGGETSIGILAQSIGGGGGNAGGSNTIIRVGDGGGAGGSGGSVTVNNTGTLNTLNDGSIGILAHSIGGGGGNGSGGAGGFVAVGGTGGSGGSAGLVNVTNGQSGQSSPANVITSGDYSAGVIAQSIGGGGGNGGYSKSYGIFASTGIGGAGGGGGSGGAVNFSNYGNFQTSGDQSQGVLLQSIGGGGGNGGAASSFTAGVAFASAVAVGGSGGAGGNGGNIGTSTNPTINSGTIYTSGNDAMGVLVQSIGGGGGNGGSTLAKSIAASPSKDIPAIALTTSIGGSGGITGDGGSAYFQNNGTITTNGINSHGVSVQSIGGGGGNGGDASNAGASTVGVPEISVEVGVGVGGSGSAGGNGGATSVLNALNSSITTSGHNASGIMAQSIGGGGGISGVGNSNQPGGASGELTFTPAIAVGGSGGAGGSGGSVNVTNAGSMVTHGTASSAVTAQSIGGGGGFGGNAGVIGTSGSVDVSVAVGGNGGAGGNAGAVTVANSGNISTGASVLFTGYNNVALGGDSHGILAQSIAGGGGVGGSADPTANMISSYLDVAMKGVDGLLTWKNIKNYFFADSGIPPLSYLAKVGVGGSGGAAGTPGVVDVTNSGTIQTIGHRSFGILAQSIGGGGGTGGSVMSGSSAVGTSLSGGIGLAALKGLTFQAGVNVGGSGGDSSAGNTVNITQSGNIVTAGYGSHGVVAQSIGGGGGVGADGSIAANTGFTGSSSVNHGVSGGFNIALGSTTSQPAIGSGGAVNYGNGGATTTSITTYGDNAVGILAQSIGGGGGIGSGGCTNNGASANASACFTNTAMTPGTSTPISFINGGQAMALSINPLAGSSSTPSNGDSVTINSNDSINMNGSGSIGIAAQSIGGGGGLILANAANISSATLPLTGTSNGAGGSVVVTSSGNTILNNGANGAIGILAQSIGGGGGYLGDPNAFNPLSVTSYSGPLINIGKSTNAGASGGIVNVTVNGNIGMYGANQIGVIAQSIGGGGGIAATNTSTTTQNPSTSSGTVAGWGQQVSVQVNGSIINHGNGGGTVGVFAQSSGNGVTEGSYIPGITVIVEGKINADTGVIISGGTNSSSSPNNLYVGNNASITVPDGNNAIVGNDGFSMLRNYGIISGGIALGPTPGYSLGSGSYIDNYGTINATGTISTSNNSLKNFGMLNVAGAGRIGVTDVYGSYKQYATGATYFDFNTTLGTNDYLKIVANSVSAGTMLQGGRFQMTRVDSNTLPTVGKTALLVTAEGGFLSSADGVYASTISIIDTSPLVKWGLIQQGNDLVAQYQGVTSKPTGYSFTQNQKNFLDYVVKSYNAGDPGIEKAIGGLVSNGAAADLKNTLNTLNGAAMTIQQQTVVMTGNTMLGNALSCPTFERNGTIYGETECVWGKYNGGQLRQAYADNNPGYRANDNTFSVGGQYRVAYDTFVGASARFGQTNSSSTNFGATANAGDVSVGIKKLVGDYYLGVSGAFGVSSQSNNRYSTDFFTGQNYNMTSHSNAYYGGIRARNAYQFNLPRNTYIKPYLDLDGLWIHTPSYQENGVAQAVPLQYSTQNSFNFIASPMVEVGGRIDLDSKEESWIRPFISAGAMFITNNTTNIAASIVGANSGTYQISAQAPSSLFKANAGIQVFSGEKVDVKLEYSAQAGQGFVGQSGTAKMNYRF